MRTTFMVVSTAVLVTVVYLYPLVLVLRGGSLAGRLGQLWLLNLGSALMLCLGIPAAAPLLSPEWGREMAMNWVPEGTLVAAMLFFGWLPPLLAGGIGFVLRRLWIAPPVTTPRRLPRA